MDIRGEPSDWIGSENDEEPRSLIHALRIKRGGFIIMTVISIVIVIVIVAIVFACFREGISCRPLPVVVGKGRKAWIDI